jgi:hypothetical protein
MFSASSRNDDDKKPLYPAKPPKGVTTSGLSRRSSWPELQTKFRKYVRAAGPAEVSTELRHLSIPRTMEVTRAWYFGSVTPAPAAWSTASREFETSVSPAGVIRWQSRSIVEVGLTNTAASPRIRTPEPRLTAASSKDPLANRPDHAPSYAHSAATSTLGPCQSSTKSPPHRASHASGGQSAISRGSRRMRRCVERPGAPTVASARMGENIDPTWICFTAEAEPGDGWFDKRLGLVRDHYQQLVDYPLAIHSALAGRAGLATIGDSDPACRWPHFARDEDLAVATAYVPTGWERIAGSRELSEAPLALARSLSEAPGDASHKLNAPAAVGLLDRRGGRLLVVNDALGAARVYEAEQRGVRAWSNRPGALVIFLGLDARADARAWQVLAAASWFLGDTAPIEGMRRLPAGTVIEAGAGGVKEHRTRALERWVAPGGNLDDLAALAMEDALTQAKGAAELWPGEAKVDLSGGRDSRLSAAAVIAAGTAARFLTSDATPGEADVARALIAAAPGDPPHEVSRTEAGSATPSTGLLERASNLHLLHDGVRHPQKLRGKMTLPRPRPRNATFSGHGGEIAHGFFYKNERQLKKVSRRAKRVPERIMRFFAKDHEAARPEAYEEAEAVVSASLDAGRAAGLDGPVLLDWFYLTDRFAHRSGLATDSERISVFATPGFIRASFALEPEDRLGDRLHLDLIGRLLPEWRDQPFFEAPKARAPAIRRDRLWEIERDVGAFEDILASGGSWTEIYREDEAKEAWHELRGGDGSAKWEAAFEGIVYRHTYDEHLRRLVAAGRG